MLSLSFHVFLNLLCFLKFSLVFVESRQDCIALVFSQYAAKGGCQHSNAGYGIYPTSTGLYHPADSQVVKIQSRFNTIDRAP
jgi:hypothetical protein